MEEVITGTFSYVHIHADDTLPISLLTASKEGGLEKDELRLFAERYFSQFSSSSFVNEQKKMLNELSQAQGGNVGDSFSGLPASVEIVVLQLPCAANGFIGVSLYCDQSGKLKNMEINKRASSLCGACAHANVIYGDAFIGRYHDDESLPWERLDFTLDDLNSDSAWVEDAKMRNAGKSYSTSGVLQNMLNSKNTAMINDDPYANLPNPRTVDTTDKKLNDYLTWSQTSEEVEIKLRLSREVKKSDIQVKLQSKKIQILVKNNQLPIDESLSTTSVGQLFTAAGAVLGGSIDADCSAWTLEKTTGGEILLVFTLAKAKEVTWTDLTSTS
jgi:hypothetical protein